MIRKLCGLVVAGLVLCAMAVAGIYWQERAALAQPLRLTQPRQLQIKPGATPGGLFRQLQSEGVLRGAFWLRLYWRRQMTGVKLQVGEYQLLPGEPVRKLIEDWHQGKVLQYRLTFPEGRVFRQLRETLGRQPKLRQLTSGLSDEQLMERLDLAGQKPEGRFFPDTYQYHSGMSDLDILRLANQRQRRILDEEWRRRDPGLPYTDPYQALIMASLVEKETAVAAERAQIAGVFVRRLQKGMLLQTDPTIIYGLGEQYHGHIGRAELDAPSPYNTYLNPGLPPTPIAAPGRQAIHAALHPAPGNALFFVARGDGSHWFSQTLAEHERAVLEYQRKRRPDYRSTPAQQERP